MEYQKCYVFRVHDDHDHDHDRPVKRRRTEFSGLQASWPQRRQAYRSAWEPIQKQIQQRLSCINAPTMTDIAAFLDETASLPAPSDRIPVGYIRGGPNSTLNTDIASQIATRTAQGTRRIFVSIASHAGSNLKSVLKTIIAKATSRVTEYDDDDERVEQSSHRNAPKLLNYDLQALHYHVRERKTQQVVIIFEDTEAFDSELLSELTELLGCWQNRIPLACLFNIATSIEYLQQRLSKAAVKCLRGKVFDAAPSTEGVEQVFRVLIQPDTSLWLGYGLASFMLERQNDFIQSLESLTQAARYAYMSHYYANALSLFLDPAVKSRDVPKGHYEAARNLPSFRQSARKLLKEGNTNLVKKLLESDSALHDYIVESVVLGRRAIAESIKATGIIQKLQTSLPNTSPSATSSIYVQAMSGSLVDSPLIRTLLLSLRKAPSNVALDAVASLKTLSLPGEMAAQIAKVADDLDQLVKAQKDAAQPLRSEDDIQNSTVRTTVVAQKVELSKQKSTLSVQDAAYTTIIRKFSGILEQYFKAKIIDSKGLAMHELFVYDLKSPCREVFDARPRHSTERALAVPHDYLDCNCCTPDATEIGETILAASQPATAVLYKLYMESGNLINAHDLWQAFCTVIGDGEDDERHTMALFQRSMAELRFLGLLRNTRKRVDHIAKVSWRDL